MSALPVENFIACLLSWNLSLTLPNASQDADFVYLCPLHSSLFISPPARIPELFACLQYDSSVVYFQNSFQSLSSRLCSLSKRAGSAKLLPHFHKHGECNCTQILVQCRVMVQILKIFKAQQVTQGQWINSSDEYCDQWNGEVGIQTCSTWKRENNIN